MSIKSKLEGLCKKNELTLKALPNGLFHIKGYFLVNYWPESKHRKAYVAGTKNGVKNVTPEQAVRMALSPPEFAPKAKRDSRTSGSRAKRQQMHNRGIDKCCWCGCPICIDTSTLEHVIPLARNGLDNANNWRLACKDCNDERGSNMPEIKNPKFYEEIQS